MRSSWFLIFFAILPVALCRFANVAQSNIEEQKSFRQQRRVRNGGIVKRALVPSLKIKSGPPEVLEVPSSENIVLECEARGNPPPTIHWLKDGRRISQSIYEAFHSSNQADEDPIPPIGLSFTKSRLYIDCAGPREEGIYTCVAENSFHKTSKSTTLTIADFPETESRAICLAKKSFGSPARIHMWTHNRLELMGSDVQLFCRSSGEPQPKVTWLKPKEAATSTDPNKYQVLENGDLIIRNIDWSDMGEYTCEVHNSQGSNSTVTFLYPTKPENNGAGV